MSKTKKTKAYTAAGVDVDLGNRLKAGLPRLLKSTHRPEVLGTVGGFGGLFRASFPAMKRPVLVASVDGVGTKLKIAFETGCHTTIGADLVNHCVNDILTLGAEPLFFLDYIGTGKLDPAVFPQIISGFAKACRATGCALIGGETAQMPSMYAAGEYDVAGTIVGLVDEKAIVDGSSIRPGDVLVAIPSNGLHTNGYSLARQLVFERMKCKINDPFPGTPRTVGEELLRVHRPYLKEVRMLKKAGIPIRGMAHITGGGLLDNLPRVLPKNCDAAFQLGSWKVEPVFTVLCEAGKLPVEEAHQVFNMGIGFVIIVRAAEAATTAKIVKGRIVGSIVPGKGQVRLLPKK
jgi:phosphoribosylformylglycinamidine cyclo-ligase